MIGVAGAGLMGSGIAAKLAAAGHGVLVFDAAPAARERLAERCAAILGELVEGGVQAPAEAEQAAGRVRAVDDLAALGAATFVVEAVPEVLAAKQALLARLEAVLAADAIVASTTSGFTPDSISARMATPERFLVAHFWNPPHLVPLVEVLAGSRTRPSAVEATLALLRGAACEPVVLRKAVPGFVGNRLQFAVLREALHLLREGVADAETIDLVVKQSLGRRYGHIGPLEGADVGGLDTFLAIASHLLPDLAKDEGVLALLEAHTARGERGRASGRGFYVWDARREAWLRAVRQRMLRGATS